MVWYPGKIIGKLSEEKEKLASEEERIENVSMIEIPYFREHTLMECTIHNSGFYKVVKDVIEVVIETSGIITAKTSAAVLGLPDDPFMVVHFHFGNSVTAVIDKIFDEEDKREYTYIRIRKYRAGTKEWYKAT